MQLKFIESKKELILRLNEKYWLRKNWKIFVKRMKKTIKITKVLWGWWNYKVREYQRFRTFLYLLEKKKRDWRKMWAERKRRAIEQKKEFEKSVAETFYRKWKFMKLKKASWEIQKTVILQNFRRLVNGRIAIRKLLLQEYDRTFWEKGVRIVIETRAAIVCQKRCRGNKARRIHKEEVRKLNEFKREYKRNRAASKIQGFFKGNHVRLKIKKMAIGTIMIQKNWRRRTVHNAYLRLREATIKIQVLEF